MIARTLGRTERTHRAVMASLLALSGVVVGYGLHDAIEPSARECVAAIHTADRLHIGMTNLLSTVQVRGDALGRTAYAEADAEVNRMLDEVEPLDEAYTAAANECTAVSR